MKQFIDKDLKELKFKKKVKVINDNSGFRPYVLLQDAKGKNVGTNQHFQMEAR